MRRTLSVALLSTTAALALSLTAHAANFGPNFGYAPRVPVSPLALSWFDPSRLHVSSTFSVGSGWGQGTSALNVTTLSYAFKAPVWMSVSVGNSFGTGFGSNRSAQFFLEGLDAAYRPLPNMTFQVHYQNYRSPLQANGYQNPLAPQEYWGR